MSSISAGAKLVTVVAAVVSGIGTGFVAFLGRATGFFVAGRFCAGLTAIFFPAAFLATGFSATTFLGLTATDVFPLAGRFCEGLAAVFFTVAFLATAFLATTFLGLTAAGVFPLTGRFFTGLAVVFFTAVFLMAAFLAATFFMGAFLAVPFFIGVFDFFFGRAGFAFPDLRTTFFADLAGFALAKPVLPVLSEVEGEAFALVFDALDFAVDADRPDFFPLALVFLRALVAIVLYLLILYGIRILASKPYTERSLYHGPRSSFNQ